MEAGISFTAIEQANLTEGLKGVATGGSVADPSGQQLQGAPIAPLPTRAAFRLSWSGEDGKYHMEPPLVVGPEGDEIVCQAPESLVAGKKYYCVVTFARSLYHASVKNEDELDGSDSGDSEGDQVDAEWRVPLFKVPPQDYEEAHADPDSGRQYHLGAVVVGGVGGGNCAWKDPS